MSKRKNPSSGSNNLNAEFCEFLMELSDYEKNVSRNIHKYNAYKKAASVLAAYDKKIESGNEARKLNGIGDKIAKKIDEFLQTGKLKKLENIHQDEDAQAINLLTGVSGIGPVKAAELVRGGIKSIEDLRNNQNKLNHHQLIGLKYYEDFEKKIPRKEIEKVECKLQKILSDFDSTLVWLLLRAPPAYHLPKWHPAKLALTICGSYRRGKAESGDIDALITNTSIQSKDLKKEIREQTLKDIIDTLSKHLITDTISMGDTKFMGVCRLSNDLPARRLDIRLIPQEQFHCAVLYFTGSDVFNKTMRAHALEKGFTLNEYSLRPVGVTGVLGEAVPISSEEDIFDYIDYPYKKPEERNL